MHRIIIFLFFTAFATISFGQTAEKQVRQAFEKYQKAIMNDKGPEAVEHVDSRTINYYAEMLETAIKADSATVAELELLDKLMVLLLRHRTPKDKLLKFDGKELLIYAIESGMVGKNTVMNNEIGDVEITEEHARGQLVIKGEPAPLYMDFYKENGQWKVDLTSAFPAARMAFNYAVKQSGEDENEFVLELLANVTGKRPGNEIWHPLM